MGAELGWSWVVGSGSLGCCLLVVSERTSLGGSSWDQAVRGKMAHCVLVVPEETGGVVC